MIELIKEVRSMPCMGEQISNPEIIQVSPMVFVEETRLTIVEGDKE